MRHRRDRRSRHALKSVGIDAAIVVATLVGAEIVARACDWSPRSRDGTSGDAIGQRRYYHSPTAHGERVPNHAPFQATLMAAT